MPLSCSECAQGINFHLPYSKQPACITKIVIKIACYRKHLCRSESCLNIITFGQFWKPLSFTSSIDSDMVPRRRMNYNEQLSDNPVTSTGGNKDENSNPLYESADKVDHYSSTANSLYARGDLQ